MLKGFIFSFTFLFLSMWVATGADAASPSLLQAKKAAEDKGYIFFPTHGEIVAGAKKEGKLRVMSGLEPPNFQPLISGFKQKYPFITDIHIEDTPGDAAGYQRVLLEIKAGRAKGWDINFNYLDFLDDYIPYQMKHDILGMAQHGVLKIDPRMVHPVEKNMVSVTSSLTVVPYNRKLISDDKVPTQWEDFLKPEFKGKKFVLDVRPAQVAGLVPAWGLERTLDYARKLAAQEPVWGRGATRMTTAVVAGEYPLYVGSNFGSIHRVMKKDPSGNVAYKIIEPAPVRVVNGAIAILNTADHPHAALLWLEFLASREGQEIIDKYEPLRASVFSPGSAIAQVTRGKKLSVVAWDNAPKFEEYLAKIVEAFGLPKTDK
jgi:iron(III) transport system substrate-binding protein